MDRGAKRNALLPGTLCFMHEERRFTRLAMVRLDGAGPGVRRYGLARLDEIALAHPPVRTSAAKEPRDDILDDGAPPCDA